MKLTWHIVAKDLRRMALPTILWLALFVAPALWFIWGATSGGILGSTDRASWAVELFSLTDTVGIVAFILAYVLVGTCVLEDPLVGTKAFWQTRPIANSRLLAAKTISVTLLFIVTPGLALLPVQIATGISLRAAVGAAVTGLQFWCVPALLAAAVASVTRTLGRFLFGSVVFVIACLVCGRLDLGMTQPTLAIQNSRDLVLELGLVVGAGAVLLHQFLTRRTMRTVLLASVFLAGAFAARQGWPWDIWTPLHRREMTTLSGDGDGGGGVEVAVRKPERDVSLAVFPADSEIQTSPVTTGRLYVPIRVSAEFGPPDTGNNGSIWVEGTPTVSAETADSLTLGRPIASATWHVRRGYVDSRAHLVGAQARSATVWLWSARPRIMGELPLAAGAAIGSGFDGTRVISVEPQRDGSYQVVLRETQAVAEPYTHPSALDRNPDHRDVYVLINRAAGRAQLLSGYVRRSDSYLSWSVGQRVLTLPPPTATDAWQRDAVIVKLRFERERTFDRSVETETHP